MRFEGTLAQWNDDRGFGFILPTEGGQTLFAHISAFPRDGQRLRGGIEQHLRALGFDVRVAQEAHLCCGSAGTYSVLQPQLSQALRTRKLGHLQALGPSVIASANIGCITHLQSGTDTPVRHWVQVLDEALAG